MTKKATFRSENDFYKTNGYDATIFDVGESLTRQEFAEECDINSLMARYEKHGTSINGLASNVAPSYIDFSSIPDTLLGYMQFMDDAQAAFMTLPAGVRREFDNSAHLFCDFASDPGNLDQMRAWGLAPPAPSPEPSAGSAAPSPASAPSEPPKSP